MKTLIKLYKQLQGINHNHEISFRIKFHSCSKKIIFLFSTCKKLKESTSSIKRILKEKIKKLTDGRKNGHKGKSISLKLLKEKDKLQGS